MTASEPTGPPLRVWLDGSLLDEADAHISPFDHGLLTGDGVFETLRVYGGAPFAVTRHLERLVRSADGIGLRVPEFGVLEKAMRVVLDANALVEARVRITVTGGRSPLGSERGDAPPTVVVAATALRPWPATVDVAVVPWPRNERGALAGLKTISYAENVRALAFAHERDAGEAIFANTVGDLCEATGSNVFVVQDGVVRTPPASSGCLLGVTRALVLERCAALDLPYEEVTLPVGALAAADEAFLTSTVREVQAIAHVDGSALPAAPGPVTRALTEAFAHLVATTADP